jgi:hypothetical protein
MDDDIKELLLAKQKKIENDPRLRSRLLIPYTDKLKEMMAVDISLPSILGWLKEKKDVAVSLKTLRKFVELEFGDEHYLEYCKRNGWARLTQNDTAPESLKYKGKRR